MTISLTSNEPFWFKRASRSLSAIVPASVRRYRSVARHRPIYPICPLVPVTSSWLASGRATNYCHWTLPGYRFSFHKDAHEGSTRLPIRNPNQFAESAREGYNYATIKEMAILESMIIGLILMTLRFSQAVRILIWLEWFRERWRLLPVEK